MMGKMVTKFDHVTLVERFYHDPVFWIEACLRIRSRTGELIPFKLNQFQRQLVGAVMESLAADGRAFFVILKGRQLGISTVCRGLMLWRALHRQGQQCTVVAHEQGLVRQNISMMRNMLEWPLALGYPKPDVISESRISWRKTGCAILPRVPAGKSEGRGMAVNFVHATEVDFYDTLAAGTWERFLGGILPAMPKKGSIFIVESTCQGRKSLYDLYLSTQQPQSEWKHLFFPWWKESQYVSDVQQDITEREKDLQFKYQLSDAQMNFWAGFARQCGTLTALREYPFCIDDAFAVAGSKSLMTATLVEQAMARHLWPLQDSEPVILGVDPSRLRDATGIALRQGKNMIEVSEIPPLGDAYELASVVKDYIRNYRASVVNVDSGGMGSAFIDILQRVTRLQVNAVDFGSKAQEDKKFYNKRAEMYDNLRKWLAEGGRLPANMHLSNELLSIEIDDRKEGRLLLGSKHKLSQSPNMADACALTMSQECFLSQRMIGKAIDIKPWNGGNY
jgi:hypothetical protein